MDGFVGAFGQQHQQPAIREPPRPVVATREMPMEPGVAMTVMHQISPIDIEDHCPNRMDAYGIAWG